MLKYIKQYRDTVNQIFDVAEELGLTRKVLAEESGLHVRTVQRTVAKQNRFVRFQTMLLLSQAVGGNLLFAVKNLKEEVKKLKNGRKRKVG